tara:strand:+ start:301 stop:1086 length:786 start_codon:yes stop_codon:yes gene_type:complete
MKFDKSINFLKDLSKRLNTYYNKKSSKKLKVYNKSKIKKKFDPVTSLDKNFEKYIRNYIEKFFPNHSIIGEEFENKITNDKHMWSIDPIDGTRAFIKGKSTWSNLISLSENKKPKIGLANFPKLNKFYINDEKNSYMYNGDKKYKIRSSNKTDLKKIIILGEFHNALSKNDKNKIMKRFSYTFKLSSFDALNYCLLAEGLIDAVIEANLKSYDILPLIPIVKNSGGIITNWRNNKANNGGNILATSNKKLHNQLIKFLKLI